MPAAVAAALVYIGASATVAATVATIAVNVALSVGLSMLANVFTNRRAERSPSDRQFLNRSPVAPRERSYGRVRLAGAQMFMAAAAGRLYRVAAVNHGEVDGFEEHYLDDKPVVVDGSGNVTDPAKYESGAEHWVRILTRTGTTTQTAYTELTAAIPEWDSTHRLRGIANIMTVFTQPPAEEISNVFPRYEATAYSVRFRGVRVLDIRTGVTAWSDNAALVCYDFCTHATGLGIPADLIALEIDTWKHAANVSGGAVAIRAGGTVPRYRIWGSYDYSERPADVFTRFMSACNGKVIPGPNGGLQFFVGEWTEPTVTIGSGAILDYQLSAGNEGPETFNVLTATYTEPDVGYVENSAQDWRVEDHITAFGELPTQAQLHCVPHHNQCRRLMKQAAAMLAPTWRGQLRTNLSALQALYERFVWIEIEEMGLLFTAEIENIQFDVEGADVIGLIIDFVSMDAETFSFNAASEEGTPSQTPPEIEPDQVPPPIDLNVLIAPRTSAGAAYAVGVGSWDAFETTGLTVEMQYRVVGASSWLSVTSTASAVTVETPQLADGVVYEFRARTRGTSVSDWTSVLTRSVVVDAVAPGIPTALSVSVIGSTATIAWRNPSSSNAYGSHIYRNTSNDSSTATNIGSVYGGPSVNQTAEDAGLGAGTYWYWVSTFNGSGVESARTLAGTQTI